MVQWGGCQLKMNELTEYEKDIVKDLDYDDFELIYCAILETYFSKGSSNQSEKIIHLSNRLSHIAGR